jgi:uncharacterized protein (DUF849 family)
MSEKVIVTAAITGAIHTPFMSDHLPITPDHIVEEIVRVYNAGGAVAHVHVRDPQTGKPVSDMELFRYILTEVRKRCPIIICTTTGGGLGMSADQRVKVVPTFKPELASFNAGSMNFALFHILDNKKKPSKFDWEDQYLAMTEDLIFPNTFRTMREFCQYFNEAGTKAELEVYDLGMINNVATMIQRGWMPEPVYIQFVLGILGGATTGIDNLLYLVRTAEKTLKNFTWSVAAAGRNQMAMCTQALLLGGNVRVGLEDNLYLEKGRMATSSAEQVEKIIRIARELGREPATPEEARKILGLKGLDKVGY